MCFPYALFPPYIFKSATLDWLSFKLKSDFFMSYLCSCLSLCLPVYVSQKKVWCLRPCCPRPPLWETTQLSSSQKLCGRQMTLKSVTPPTCGCWTMYSVTWRRASSSHRRRLECTGGRRVTVSELQQGCSEVGVNKDTVMPSGTNRHSVWKF